VANQHSKDVQAVTYRLDPALVAAVRAEAKRRGEDQRALVARALWREIGGNPNDDKEDSD